MNRIYLRTTLLLLAALVLLTGASPAIFHSLLHAIG